MRGLRSVVAWLAAVAVTCGPCGSGLAAERGRGPVPGRTYEKSVLNKEGIWRLAAEGDRCLASATLENGDDLILMARFGKLGFGLGSDHPSRPGRKGSFETEAYAFEFKPSYTENGILYLDDNLSERAITALRQASDLRITVDGRVVAQAHIGGSGVGGALDAAIACSRGEKGWWGAGAAR